MHTTGYGCYLSWATVYRAAQLPTSFAILPNCTTVYTLDILSFHTRRCIVKDMQYHMLLGLTMTSNVRCSLSTPSLERLHGWCSSVVAHKVPPKGSKIHSLVVPENNYVADLAFQG